MADLQLTDEHLSSIAKQLVGPIVQQVKHELAVTSPVAHPAAPVVKEVAPMVSNVVNEQVKEDRIADAYDDTEIALITELKCPRLYTTRGKNGRSYTTNLTSQSLQTLRDERADRKNYQHRI